MKNLKVNYFFILIFSFALLFNFYSISFSEPDCDNCPLKNLCDEHVLDCNPPFCEDEAYRKYFDPFTGKAKENALALISAGLNLGTLEAAVSAATTNEIGVETSGVSAVKSESSVETVLNKDAVIN